MIDKVIKYVWIDERSNDEYAHISKCYQVCIMSSLVANPDYKVIIYSNKPIYWDDLKPNGVKYDNLVNEIISEDDINEVNNLGIKIVAHKSDYIRYKILLQDGGIYADTDIFMLKSLDDLLDNKVVLAREKPTTVCCAFIMAQSGHNIFKDILDKYHDDYKPNEWLYNSQYILRSRAKAYSDIKILEYKEGFFYPNWKSYPMCIYYDNHIISNREDIGKKFIGYAQHIWSSTPAGDRLKSYINENCLGIRDINSNKTYIFQLIQYIYREYYNIIGVKI